MNKRRRNKIRKALDLIGKAKDLLIEVADEEQGAYNKLSERQQESEKGELMSEYIDYLLNYIDTIEECHDVIIILEDE